MAVQKKIGKLKPESGYSGFKSPRSAGKSINKPSNPDSGNPSAQYQQQGPANSWPSGSKPDSGKPNENR